MEKEKILKISFVFVLIVAILLGILLWFSGNRINKLKQVEGLYSTSQNTLKIVKDKLDRETATIEVLTSENAQLFVNLNIKDKEINKLQSVVKVYEKKVGNLNTAIIVSNETIVKLQDSLKSIIIGYTNNIDTPTIHYPIYYQKFEREWSSGEVTMGFDTLALDLKIRNEYDITIGDEKVSLFKRKSYANITNLNPDTETKVFKVYDKVEKKDHFIRNAGIFAGIGLLGGLLIK